MDVDQAREFLRSNHRAVLSTVRRDGRPAMSPVAAVVDAAGRVMVSTRETALKVMHVRRDPRVALCVFPDGFYGTWAQVEGVAEVVALPDALDLLVDYYRRAAGEHPDWDDYRRAMTEERRVVLRFAIDRAGPTISG